MKNLVIFILFIMLVVVGYVAASSKLRLSLEGLEGKQAKVIRGDITLPINATGEIRPFRRVELKAEASGEVIEITRRPGERVSKGDLLIRLRRDDEQRNVNRAQLELDTAAARMEEAKLRWEQAKTSGLHQAESQVRQLEQRVRLARYRVAKLAELPAEQKNAEEELERETTYLNLMAQLDGAKAGVGQAKLAIPREEQLVKQARAQFETAKNNLGDARKRLEKTDVVAPIDGVVADIRTQIGEVIQGGKTTLTGGTVLAVVLDLDRLMVRAEADEADIGRVLEIAPPWALPGRDSSVRMPDAIDRALENIQHPPTITVESFRDEEFVGVIERIYPEPDTQTGVVTYLVDVVIAGRNRLRLLPGMRADVRFTSEHKADIVLCPNEAIREGPGGKLGVYVMDKAASSPDERKTQFIPCVFGLDNGNYSEVKEGLAEGTDVYIKLPRKSDKQKKDNERRRRS